MHQTTLNFPEINLQRRHGHKLRGYFANLFGKESDLFHNHDQDGRQIYRYPRIQYKVVNGTPMMVGIEEGAKLIIERFLQINEIEIEGKVFSLNQKNMKSEEVEVTLNGTLHAYEFVNPWMPLNQDNYERYQSYDEAGKQKQLKSILVRNILNVFSVGGYHAKEEVMVHLETRPARVSMFKNQEMLTFQGKFVTNAVLPDYVGLGKSVSRGFGTIVRK